MKLLKQEYDKFLRKIKRIEIDNRYEIPYFAGYNWEGNKVYVDKNTPKTIIIKNKKLNIHHSLAMHEYVEKHFVNRGYTYAGAHEIATEFEKKFVKSHGIKWKDYDHEVGKLMHASWISKLHGLKSIPRDIDMTPMEYERDIRTLTKMRKLLK